MNNLKKRFANSNNFIFEDICCIWIQIPSYTKIYEQDDKSFYLKIPAQKCQGNKHGKKKKIKFNNKKKEQEVWVIECSSQIFLLLLKQTGLLNHSEQNNLTLQSRN